MNSTLFQNVISLMSASAGALISINLGVTHRQLCALISFAAGTLLATTLFHIVPESLVTVSFFTLILALASGYFLFFIISRFLFHVCPACAASHFDEQTTSNFKNTALLLFIAFGIHCTMDGIALALGGELSKHTDRSIFIAVAIHKLPEGLALSALLLRGGFEKLPSFLLTMALESLTLLGWALGLLLVKGFTMGDWYDLILLHVGGGFLYLAFHAVLNEAEEHSPRYIFFFFILGMAVVGLSLTRI